MGALREKMIEEIRLRNFSPRTEHSYVSAMVGLVRLKVSAIDSHRMMVRVEQGKGIKDRYTILSQRLLSELRSHWKERRSPTYLFPNRRALPSRSTMLRKSTTWPSFGPASTRGTAFIRSAGYHHTTHKLSFKKIHYRYHPFCGTEVEVVRALRRFGGESFVAKLPDGHQIAVPAWMLDPVFCHQLPQRGHPLITLKALLQLAELIERQGLSWSASHSQSEPSLRGGGIDALRTEKILSSAKAALCEKGAMGETSPTSRVRCRDLIVELLRAVVLARQDTGREDERKA